jgi:hypothetical protein
MKRLAFIFVSFALAVAAFPITTLAAPGSGC